MGVIEIVKRQAMQQSRQQGQLEGKTQMIRNLILKHGWTDKQIADVAEVPVSFVKKIRASLKKQE
jgi:DNA-directed RNA polymerase specialized sigma subunit